MVEHKERRHSGPSEPNASCPPSSPHLRVRVSRWGSSISLDRDYSSWAVADCWKGWASFFSYLLLLHSSHIPLEDTAIAFFCHTRTKCVATSSRHSSPGASGCWGTSATSSCTNTASSTRHSYSFRVFTEMCFKMTDIFLAVKKNEVGFDGVTLINKSFLFSVLLGLCSNGRSPLVI